LELVPDGPSGGSSLPLRSRLNDAEYDRSDEAERQQRSKHVQSHYQFHRRLPDVRPPFSAARFAARGNAESRTEAEMLSWLLSSRQANSFLRRREPARVFGVSLIAILWRPGHTRCAPHARVIAGASNGGAAPGSTIASLDLRAHTTDHIGRVASRVLRCETRLFEFAEDCR
jgi:hypothetical protein